MTLLENSKRNNTYNFMTSSMWLSMGMGRMRMCCCACDKQGMLPLENKLRHRLEY